MYVVVTNAKYEHSDFIEKVNIMKDKKVKPDILYNVTNVKYEHSDFIEKVNIMKDKKVKMHKVYNVTNAKYEHSDFIEKVNIMKDKKVKMHTQLLPPSFRSRIVCHIDRDMEGVGVDFLPGGTLSLASRLFRRKRSLEKGQQKEKKNGWRFWGMQILGP
ncbi:hypothetical protein CDAR_378211 [Caerostris darwini]|uniref:Uncharacterized protein n=1 Tax=Caerostris darwini TaxID=1538125 RepID=A0AAV4PKI0_9ARAC|nr:hypothetical protein CDAR_378211 [Caerostris darwini]